MRRLELNWQCTIGYTKERLPIVKVHYRNLSKVNVADVIVRRQPVCCTKVTYTRDDVSVDDTFIGRYDREIHGTKDT
jgi:hypothetical protein